MAASDIVSLFSMNPAGSVQYPFLGFMALLQRSILSPCLGMEPATIFGF